MPKVHVQNLAAKAVAVQTARRKVQRKLMTSFLLCGLGLVVFYAILVIITGLFVIYSHFTAESLSQLNEKMVLSEDPVARLLEDDVSGASKYDDGSESEVVEVVDQVLNPRLPLELGLTRLLKMRKMVKDKGRRKKRSVDSYFGPNSTVVNDFSDASRPRRSSSCSEQSFRHMPNRTVAEEDVFPDDLFSLQQRRRGAIILHFCGMCYMFVALAIVCDEFFVPSLGVITESLAISDDVAGATFMAAGGSAPEFFTSVFGVFITENNVGVGTIVGSATFNILFVLAFCCLFSKEILHLTWWPMFRDMSFYVASLSFLLVFFYDEKVDYFEAGVLFILYILYGVFMKYNSQIELLVKRNLFGKNLVGPQRQMIKQELQDTRLPSALASQQQTSMMSPRGERQIPVLHSGAMFRSGIMQMALDGVEGASDTSSLPDRLYEDFTPRPEPSPRFKLQKSRSQPSIKHPTLTVDRARAALPSPVRPNHNYNNDSSAASSASAAQPEEANVDFEQSSVTSVANSSVWSNSTALVGNCNSVTDVQLADFKRPGSPTPPTRANAPPSINIGGAQRQKSAEVDVEKPVDISWPATFSRRCIYVCLAPIMIPLYFTIADVKKPDRQKYVVWTFCGSILWIAFYSYLMVWWANTIGTTIGIPNEIMGLTILAAGTSIPDLITSILVARKGLGDMAVSSSIGSNLFDVCVGLPIPWLLKFATDFALGHAYKPISVVSNGLICSVGMLFMMLLMLYGTVAMFGWRMNKKFGVTMLLSYIVFCILCILLELNVVLCPLRRISHHC